MVVTVGVLLHGARQSRRWWPSQTHHRRRSGTTCCRCPTTPCPIHMPQRRFPERAEVAFVFSRSFQQWQPPAAAMCTLRRVSRVAKRTPVTVSCSAGDGTTAHGIGTRRRMYASKGWRGLRVRADDCPKKIQATLEELMAGGPAPGQTTWIPEHAGPAHASPLADLA